MDNEQTTDRRSNPTDSDNRPAPAGASTSNAMNCQGTVAGPFGWTTMDDHIYRDGAQGGCRLKVDEVDVGDSYTSMVPVPKGVRRARIVTASREATTGRAAARPGQKGTFVYEATAGSATSPRLNHIKTVPVSDGKES